MLNRLIVAAVLLFAFAECQYMSQYTPQYSPTPTIPYGGASPYGGGYGGAMPYGGGYGGYGGGYGGYGYSRSYANSPIDQLSMGGTNFNVGNKGPGYLPNSPYGTYDTPYYPTPYPYQGSPIGYYDAYPRSYYELYGGVSRPDGPPPPPPYSGGAPFGHYEPDTYASGLPPVGWTARPGPFGSTPIIGYKGALPPNPFAMVDPDDVAYISFQTQYKNNYGRKYDPANISGVVKPPTAPAPSPSPYAPGTNFYGINYGQNFGYGNTAPFQYNGYGQQMTTPPMPTPAPPATTAGPAPGK